MSIIDHYIQEGKSYTFTDYTLEGPRPVTLIIDSCDVENNFFLSDNECDIRIIDHLTNRMREHTVNKKWIINKLRPIITAQPIMTWFLRNITLPDEVRMNIMELSQRRKNKQSKRTRGSRQRRRKSRIK